MISTYKITIVKPYNKKVESSQANPRILLIMENFFSVDRTMHSFQF